MKSMEKRGQGKPLIALRRKRKGPRGQPKGSIRTDPDEVDQIIRDAYGKIYEGNSKDQTKLMQDYFEEYEKYIYTAPEVQAEPLTGKDLQQPWTERKRRHPVWTNGHQRILSYFRQKHIKQWLKC